MVQQRLAISIPNIGSSNAGGIGRSATSMDSPASDADSSADISLFSDTPLLELSANTRLQLSQLLNCRKILRSEDGYERDWRGVAELAEVRSFCNESNNDPMRTVLREWCAHKPQTANFARLQQFLGIIDRWDVSDDIYENLVEDAKQYATKLRQKSLIAYAADTTDSNSYNAAASTTSSSTALYFNGDVNSNGNRRETNPNILTRDDVLLAQKGLPPQQYDAFVLYADADIEQAAEIQTKFEENEKFNFKLCFKNRDVLAGIPFTHMALTQLIEERCRYLLVILTKEFLDSPENQFLVNYTQALQIENKTRKIIPLIYEDSIEIPLRLRMYTHLKYSPNPNSLFNFWTRLADSIRRTGTSTEAASPTFSYTEIDSMPLRQLSTDTAYSSLPSPRTPTPTTPIPSININGHAYMPDDETQQMKKEASRFQFTKRSSLRQHTNNNSNSRINQLTNGHGGLRNAHSTSQLTAYGGDNSVSMSDLSLASETKKKKKKPIKEVLKKVFSRSNPKLLQEPE